MIVSMTGFSRQTHEADWGAVTWEIRSVNHRYLEPTLRLPEPLRDVEKLVRARLQSHLSRGKVDLVLRFQPGKHAPFDIEINEDLVNKLSDAAECIDRSFSGSSINAMDVLNWPGVLRTKDTGMDLVAEAALSLLDHALQDLCAMRAREGAGLQAFLEQRLVLMEQEIEVIQQRMPSVLEAQRERITRRFDELSLALDSERIEQEMTLLIQKSDIAEELQRLIAHMAEVRSVLEKGGVVGRRLDFLMQELNREANTLGSKSIDPKITQSVVELKVQIEQMREQVQNIE